MTRIKVCGVMLPDDAAMVAAAGVDFIGLNFWEKSKRHVTPERAPMVAAAARGAGTAKIVGVFVDPDLEDIREITSRVALDAIQLHGDESAELCKKISAATYLPIWKAVAVGQSRDVEHLEVWPVDAVLLDAPAALTRHAKGAAPSRPVISFALAREARERHPARQFVLAGGLDAGNITEAIATVEPWCVDVASGVEAGPGIKDAAKVAAFVAAARYKR
jgi:phosphoribosylanthranilate isomerase